MARREVNNDLVFGREAIAEIIGTTGEGVKWLHSQGRLPVVRVDRTYMANRRALEAAKASGFRRPPGRKPKVEPAREREEEFA